MAIPPIETFVPICRGAKFVKVIIPPASDALTIEPGSTDAASVAELALNAVLAFTAEKAYGTLKSCCLGRISDGLVRATPLLTVTVTPRNTLLEANAYARLLTAGTVPGIEVPPGEPRMTLKTPFA